MRIELIYSRDDAARCGAGWHAEVWDWCSGRTLFTTALHVDRAWAYIEAVRWAAQDKPPLPDALAIRQEAAAIAADLAMDGLDMMKRKKR